MALLQTAACHSRRSELTGDPKPGEFFFDHHLPAIVDALSVWRRYHGRADIENRIRELGQQFGIMGLTAHQFWATEAMHHLAIAAYNLCVLLQRKLGQLEKCELNTLRWRLFSRAAVWSRARGKPTLKLAVRGEEARVNEQVYGLMARKQALVIYLGPGIDNKALLAKLG